MTKNSKNFKIKIRRKIRMQLNLKNKKIFKIFQKTLDIIKI